MEYNVEKFLNEIKNMNISLTENQIEKFIIFYEMLVEKNKVMNLTAITDFDEVFEKHFADSLSLAYAFDLKQEMSMIDLGTGAGFPGIPLKIVFPQIRMTLADSLNKRILFLNEVIEKIGLKDAETVHGRAEDLARKKKFRESFDLCVSRAVANLSTLTEYCLPFVKENGNFVSYKGADCDEEVEAAKSSVHLLGGRIKKVKKFELGESRRAFVIIEKKKSTPKKYPRKAGTPVKDPL